MRRSRLAAAGLAVAVGLGAATATAGSAFAAVTVTTRDSRVTPVLDTLRSRCEQAVDPRVSALEAAGTVLAQAKAVTTDHRSALSSILTGDETALQALKTKIQSDPDLATLTADCRSIFTDYRVFALVLPRTRLVAAADIAGAAADRLTTVADALDAAIAKAHSAGRDTAAATADLAAMRAKIDAGRTAAGGVAGQIMGLTPADWNANHDVLAPARQSLRTARADLGAARDLGRKVIADLRA
jgi:hypothetical protein